MAIRHFVLAALAVSAISVHDRIIEATGLARVLPIGPWTNADAGKSQLALHTAPETSPQKLQVADIRGLTQHGTTRELSMQGDSEQLPPAAKAAPDMGAQPPAVAQLASAASVTAALGQGAMSAAGSLSPLAAPGVDAGALVRGVGNGLPATGAAPAAEPAPGLPSRPTIAAEISYGPGSEPTGSGTSPVGSPAMPTPDQPLITALLPSVNPGSTPGQPDLLKEPMHAIASLDPLPREKLDDSLTGGASRPLPGGPERADPITFQDGPVQLDQEVGPTAIPEPATTALMLAGLAGACFMTRRRRSR